MRLLGAVLQVGLSESVSVGASGWFGGKNKIWIATPYARWHGCQEEKP